MFVQSEHYGSVLHLSGKVTVIFKIRFLALDDGFDKLGWKLILTLSSKHCMANKLFPFLQLRGHFVWNGNGFKGSKGHVYRTMVALQLQPVRMLIWRLCPGIDGKINKLKSLCWKDRCWLYDIMWQRRQVAGDFFHMSLSGIKELEDDLQMSEMPFYFGGHELKTLCCWTISHFWSQLHETCHF